MPLLQDQLLAYEEQLPDLLQDLDAWTYQDVNVHRGAIAFDRLWRNMPNGDRLHVHCIPPNPEQVPYLHAHGRPTALHLLGPGAYELGWGASERLHGRSVVPGGPWYYEMITGHIQHYVRVLGPEPVYSIMLWPPDWPPPHRGADLDPSPAPLTPPQPQPDLIDAIGTAFAAVHSK